MAADEAQRDRGLADLARVLQALHGARCARQEGRQRPTHKRKRLSCPLTRTEEAFWMRETQAPQIILSLIRTSRKTGVSGRLFVTLSVRTEPQSGRSRRRRSSLASDALLGGSLASGLLGGGLLGGGLARRLLGAGLLGSRLLRSGLASGLLRCGLASGLLGRSL